MKKKRGLDKTASGIYQAFSCDFMFLKTKEGRNMENPQKMLDI